MASKMIGKNVRVVGGRNSGAVGVIESDNAARGQYIIRVSSGKSRGYKISAKYQFVSIDYGNSSNSLEALANKYEGKIVIADTYQKVESSSSFPIPSVFGLVTLVYEDEVHGIVANVVYDGEYSVVPVSALELSRAVLKTRA